MSARSEIWKEALRLQSLLKEACDLLADSRKKFASIVCGADDDHDGFTYEEIGSLAEQGARAIDEFLSPRDRG